MKLVNFLSGCLLCLVLLVPTLLNSGCCIPLFVESEQVRIKMTNYLETTYNVKFVVEMPSLSSSSFGFYYVAQAHPKNNPEIQFKIREDVHNKSAYFDYYLDAMWSYQGKKELDAILKEQYGDNYYLYNYDVTFGHKDFKTLNHPDVLTKSGGEVDLLIEYFVFRENSIDKKDEAEKVFYILDKFMLNNRLKKYRIRVGYSTPKYKSNNFFKNEYNTCHKAYDELLKEGVFTDFIDFEQLAMSEADIKKVEFIDIYSSFNQMRTIH